LFRHTRREILSAKEGKKSQRATSQTTRWMDMKGGGIISVTRVPIDENLQDREVGKEGAILAQNNTNKR